MGLPSNPYGNQSTSINQTEFDAALLAVGIVRSGRNITITAGAGGTGVAGGSVTIAGGTGHAAAGDGSAIVLAGGGSGGTDGKVAVTSNASVGTNGQVLKSDGTLAAWAADAT